MDFKAEEVRKAVEGGTWVFLGSVVSSLLGFAFWFLMTWLTGVRIMGIVSSIASSACISSSVVCAGMNIAVMREVAANGERAFTSALVLGAALSVVAAAATVPLALLLGYGSFCSLASILTGAGVMSTVLGSSLMGFERFREFFLVTLSGSAVKLILGSALVIAGFGAGGVLLGYVSMPLFASVIALLLLLPMTTSLDLSEIRELLSLSLSNYPYVFSNQMVVMLSIYLFAYLTGREILTGILYISLMIVLAIASISGSVLNAALPVGTRRNADPFAESFRVGLGFTTPVLVITLSLSANVLGAINPGLLPGSNVLRMLLLSLAPFSAITAVAMKLNREKRRRDVSALGVLRLTLLIVLLLIMTRIWGVEGAALAFLLANALPALLALRYDRALSSPLMVFWSLHLISYLMSVLTTPLVASVLSLAVAITTMQISRSLTLKEVRDILAIAASSVIR